MNVCRLGVYWERLSEGIISSMNSILIGLGGAILLTIYFSALRTDWPENYSTAQSVVENNYRRGPLRYFLFRVLPVFVVCLLVAKTAEDLDVSSGPAVAVVVVLHLAATNVRASIALLRARHRTRRSTLLVYHALVAGLVGGAAVVGYATRDLLSGFVPTPNDLVFAVWTGAFVAIVGVVVRRKAEFSTNDFSYDAGRVEKDVGSANWAYVLEAAERHNCDPYFLRSIIAAECNQRPRWMRRLERLKGILVKSGTYGVAQMGADRPISDRESIDRLAATFEGYYPSLHAEYGTPLQLRMAGMTKGHNPDPAFVESVSSWYMVLAEPLYASSEKQALDGRPLIELREIHRDGASWRLSGTALIGAPDLLCLFTAGDSRVQQRTANVAGASDARGVWRLDIPFEASKVTLRVPGRAHGDPGRTVTVEL